MKRFAVFYTHVTEDSEIIVAESAEAAREEMDRRAEDDSLEDYKCTEVSELKASNGDDNDRTTP